MKGPWIGQRAGQAPRSRSGSIQFCNCNTAIVVCIASPGNQDVAIAQQRCSMCTAAKVHTGCRTPYTCAGSVDFRAHNASKGMVGVSSSDQYPAIFEQRCCLFSTSLPQVPGDAPSP